MQTTVAGVKSRVKRKFEGRYGEDNNGRRMRIGRRGDRIKGRGRKGIAIRPASLVLSIIRPSFLAQPSFFSFHPSLHVRSSFIPFFFPSPFLPSFFQPVHPSLLPPVLPVLLPSYPPLYLPSFILPFLPSFLASTLPSVLLATSLSLPTLVIPFFLPSFLPP